MVKYLKYICLAAFLCFNIACSREALREEENPVHTMDGFEQRPLVPMKIYIGTEGYVNIVDGVEVTETTTKADPFSYSTETADDREIYNLWILEFEQDGDHFVLNAQPTYVADYPSYFNDEGDAIKTIGVPASSKYCTILFMANTGLPDMTFSPGTTLEQFKEARFAQIDYQSDLFGWDKTKGKYAPRFNGTTETDVNTSISSIGTKASPVQLKRAMARLDVTVTNLSLRGTTVPAEERIHLRHVRMNNVQNKSFYYTNYDDYATSTTLYRPMTAAPLSVSADGYDWGMDTHKPADWAKMVGYSDWYDKDGNKIDPAPSGADEIRAAIEAGSAPTVATARFFLPGNLRPDRPLDATSLTLVGEYTKEGNTYQVSYDIPLREDLGGGNYCYAVRPNHKYTINVTLNKLGDTDVEDFADAGVKDFTHEELANCYICNPSPIKDLYRVFKFPVAKVNSFWGDPQYARDEIILSSTYPGGGAKYGRDFAIGENDVWTAFILWADFDPEGKIEMVDLFHLKNDGTAAASGEESVAGKGIGYDPSDKGVFAVRVKGEVSGNAVIAVKKKIGDGSGAREQILWSWHLWITDYNPDSEISLNGDTYDWYLHQVEGGSVFRLNNYIFNSGRYRKSYAMDRTLGFLYDPRDLIGTYRANDLPADIEVPNGGQSRRGLGFFYAFGKKDPIPCPAIPLWYPVTDPARAYQYNIDGGWVEKDKDCTRFKRLHNSYFNNINYPYPEDAQGMPKSPIYFSIMYPMIGWNGNDNSWNFDDKFNPQPYDSEILWNDPYFYERVDEVATNSLGFRKSMFDPCPPGWSIPYNEKVGSATYTYLDNIYEKESTYNKYVYVLKPGSTINGILIWPEKREIPNSEITSDKYKTAVFFPVTYTTSTSYNYTYTTTWWAKHFIKYWTGNNYSYNQATVLSLEDNLAVQANNRVCCYQIRCVKNVRPE